MIKNTKHSNILGVIYGHLFQRYNIFARFKVINRLCSPDPGSYISTQQYFFHKYFLQK